MLIIIFSLLPMRAAAEIPLNLPNFQLLCSLVSQLTFPGSNLCMMRHGSMPTAINIGRAPITRLEKWLCKCSVNII